MARIPLPDEQTLTPEQRRVFDEVVAGPRGALIGPLRAALYRPDLADAWQKFGSMLRFDTSLPPRLSELAIVVTARRWNSQLEWHIHAAAAARGGLPSDVLDAISHGDAPVFDDVCDMEIYEFARELQLSGQVSDSTYDHVRRRWGPLGVVELTTLIGYYTLVSMTLNAHHIPLPDDAAPPLELTGPCTEDALLPVRLAALPRSRMLADADRTA